MNKIITVWIVRNTALKVNLNFLISTQNECDINGETEGMGVTVVTHMNLSHWTFCHRVVVLWLFFRRARWRLSLWRWHLTQLKATPLKRRRCVFESSSPDVQVAALYGWLGSFTRHPKSRKYEVIQTDGDLISYTVLVVSCWMIGIHLENQIPLTANYPTRYSSVAVVKWILSSRFTGHDRKSLSL